MNKLLFLILGLMVQAIAGACVPELPQGANKKIQTIVTPSYALSFMTVPETVKVGESFSIDWGVCVSDRSVSELRSVSVDAFMPEHNHGMNDKPTIIDKGHGLYHADGLMFHMSGQWDYIFILRTESSVARLSKKVWLK